MSAFPEFKKGGPSQPSLGGEPKAVIEKLTGILTLVTGLTLTLGFFLTGLTSILIGAGTIGDVPGAAKTGPLAGIFGGLLGLILAVFIMLSTFSAKKGQPFKWLKISAIIWAAMVVLVALLATIFAAAGSDKIPWSDASTALNVLALIGGILIIVGIFLAKPQASFSMYMAGAGLLLVGVVLLLVGASMGGGLNDSAYVLGYKGTDYSQFLAIASFTNTVILVGLLIAVIGLIIVPFIGSQNIWVLNFLAVIGLLIGSAGSIYYSARVIGDFKDAMKYSSGLDKAAAAVGLVASVIMTIAMILLLILSILLLIGLILKTFAGAGQPAPAQPAAPSPAQPGAGEGQGGTAPQGEQGGSLAT